MKLTYCSVLLLFITINSVSGQTNLDWTKKVGAKHYPQKTTTLYVNDNGAVTDGKTINTAAIQKTIDQCSAKGGGIVSFKPGKYLTGSIFIKKNVCLNIDQGVELMGSQDLKDYPEIDTRVAGIEMKWPAALINIIGQTNAAIRGKGLVNAQGKPFWDIYCKMR